jgi:hypothetical protein
LHCWVLLSQKGLSQTDSQNSFTAILTFESCGSVSKDPDEKERGSSQWAAELAWSPAPMRDKSQLRNDNPVRSRPVRQAPLVLPRLPQIDPTPLPRAGDTLLPISIKTIHFEQPFVHSAASFKNSVGSPRTMQTNAWL